MATKPEMSAWTDLLHSCTKQLEQAAPSAHFPPLLSVVEELGPTGGAVQKAQVESPKDRGSSAINCSNQIRWKLVLIRQKEKGKVSTMHVPCSARCLVL
ncbi:hypothetical protein H6P81_015488 [Aristolochia fimbriata]|uniref:Uncharacterized protein n=1 Tax=Aristolochia fimbriata TaxID=158543 RepID=A0AAV7E674_ARIFI|nr:hypothetical protein H6P81_015488 [Aristolochia fimbriata]